MTALLHLLQHLSPLVVALASSAFLAGSILTIAVALSLRLLPALSAAVRSLIWTAVFACSLVLPVLIAVTRANYSVRLPAAPAVTLNLHWAVIVTALWLAGSCYRVTRLILSAVRVHALWLSAEPLDATTVSTVASFARPSRTAAVCLSNAIAKPVLIGFFRPRILLPAALHAQLSGDELQSILLHETEHLRRRDDWLNLIQKVALAVFAIHPVLLWVERRLCLERELACDDRVLHATGAPRRYASCLVDLAERCVLSRHVALALGAWGTRSELSLRVQHILDRCTAAPRQPRPLPTTAFLAALAFVSATAFLRCPQVVVLTDSTLASSIGAHITSFSPSPADTGLQTVRFAAVATSAARLIPATLHSPQARTFSRKPAIPASHAAFGRSKLARYRVTPAAARLVYASVRLGAVPQQISADPSATRLILTVFTPGLQSSSYAAVPYRDGWLIVQL